MRISKTDLAWAAGFLDGEGCFHIRRPKPSKWRGSDKVQKWGYNVLVAASSCDYEPIKKLERMFGGATIYYTSKKQHQRPVYHWKMFANDSRKAIPLLLPYLVLKRKRAMLVAQLLARMGVKRNRPGGLSQNEHAIRNRIVERLKVMNRRGC